MNGPARKIEILAPFNQAIELTRLILFRPFDITKWLVIGFAAFLSGWFNSGGGSINPWSFRRWNTSSLQAPTFQFRSFNMDHAGMVLLIAAAVFVVAIFCPPGPRCAAPFAAFKEPTAEQSQGQEAGRRARGAGALAGT